MNTWRIRFEQPYVSTVLVYHRLARQLTDAGFIVHFCEVESELPGGILCAFNLRHSSASAMTRFLVSETDTEFTVESK